MPWAYCDVSIALVALIVLVGLAVGCTGAIVSGTVLNVISASIVQLVLGPVRTLIVFIVSTVYVQSTVSVFYWTHCMDSCDCSCYPYCVYRRNYCDCSPVRIVFIGWVVFNAIIVFV